MLNKEDFLTHDIAYKNYWDWMTAQVKSKKLTKGAFARDTHLSAIIGESWKKLSTEEKDSWKKKKKKFYFFKDQPHKPPTEKPDLENDL